MSFYNFGSGLNEIDLVYENTAENVELSNLSMRVSVVEDELSNIPDTTDLNNLFITVDSNTSNIAINTGAISLLNNSLDIAVSDISTIENRVDDIDLDLINFDLRLNDDETIINLNSSNIIIASNNNLSNLLKINDLIINDIALDVRLDVIETASASYVTLNGSETITNKIFSYNSNQFLDFPTSGGGGDGDVTLNGMQTLTNKTIDYNNNQLQNLPVFDDSAIQTDLSLLDGRVTANEADIIIHSDAIIDLNDRVDVTNSRVDAAESNIDDATVLIATNITDILTNETNISSLSNALATDITNLATLNGTVTTHTGQIATNTTSLTTLSNALANDISNLATLSGTVSTHTGQISTNITNITSLSNALATDISNLVTLSGTVSTHTGQISTNTSSLTTLSNALATDISNLATLSTTVSTNTTNISNRVIAPATNTASYIPQWAGANSKTLVNGIDLATLTSLTGTQSLTNKTITGTTNNVSAKSLLSATTTVDVFSAAAPSSNQVLTATSSTTAEWKTPVTGSNVTNNITNLTPNYSNIVNINSNLSVDVTNITNIYKFRAYVSADYDNTSNPGFGAPGVFNTIRLDTKSYDLNTNFSTTTFGYTVPVTGYYDVESSLKVNYQGGTGGAYDIQLMTTTGTVLSSASTYQTAGGLGESLKINDKLLLTAGQIIVVKVKSPGTVGTYTYGNSYLAMALVNSSAPATIPITTTQNVNYYSYSAGTGNVMTGQINSNNYIPVWSSNASTYLNNGVALTDLTAYNLASATTTVSISSATAPSSNQILTAISASNAVWKNPSSGSSTTIIPYQVTSSATTYTFTGIPSTANQIMMHFYFVQALSTGNAIVRLGDSTGLFSANYISVSSSISTAGAIACSAYTNGFNINGNNNTGTGLNGSLTFTKTNGTFVWNCSGSVCLSGAATNFIYSIAGMFNGAYIDRIGLVVPSGCQATGAVNITYQ